MGGGPAIATGGTGYTQFIDPNKTLWKNPRILALNGWIILLLITSSTNGYDGSMMNGLQSLTQWQIDFNHPTGSKLGLLNAIQARSVGALTAYPFSPYVADGFGRRAAIFFGSVLMIIGTVLQTVSHSVGMFIGARFLVGFGLTFAAGAAPLLVSEVAFPSHRAQATSMYNTMWYLGSIIAAWTTFGTFHIASSWAWRIPSAIQGLPSVLQLVLIWFVPESPRWLMRHGKEDQALDTLAYYHGNGDKQNPLVEYEFEEIKAAIALDSKAEADVGWVSLFSTPGNLKRVRIIVALAVFSQWSGNGLASYYLNAVLNNVGITNPTTQLLINGVLNIFNFIVAIIAGMLCDKVGRRPLFLISVIGMLLSWTVQTVCYSLYFQHQSVVAGHGVIAMIFMFYAFCEIAFTPLIVSYTVEILPYSLRAKGFTLFNFAGSMAIIFNQYINPVALNKLGWKYYLVYVFWLAFEVVFCYFYVVETKNRTLEETSALFDGDQSAEKMSENATGQVDRGSTIVASSFDQEKGASKELSRASTPHSATPTHT
ncbi:hypothetical protein PLICRDRAFT_134162 [Plicaturopsis crispa FD-325 SS-3]|nr:hypothetical protein PLICRDRAFT_134162 [Plicaturopsis crispa FD-325 SS-3]